MSLDDLPLFPLHTVLFPGGLLPLQVFEVRYLDLMKRCEKSGEPFGVVSLESGEEVKRAPRPGEPQAPAERFASIGTLAYLEKVVHPRAGLVFVLARGGQRFELASSKSLPHGLWTGQARLLPDDAATSVPEELSSLSEQLRQMLEPMYQQAALSAPSPEDPCWRDAGWVANRWAERLPLPALERQRLMSLDNPAWRLELVAEWLDELGKRQTDRR